jgi:hypothetical protein
VHTARVVADHSAKRAAIVRCRIGPESQVISLGSIPQVIENNPRLNPGNPLFRIDLKNPCHIFRHVQDKRYIAALSRERSSGAAAENRGPELARQRNGRNYVLGIARQNHPNGYLPVIGSIRGVERTTSFVETHFAAKMAAESRFQPI